MVIYYMQRRPIARGKQDRPEVEDPLKLIEGKLSHLRGKYTSVKLQHEMKKLWLKR